MDDLKFKVSSELKNILGKDLITNANIAVLELVKNSYDAHATKVEISLYDGQLIISDNGKGMSYDDLINKWLFVGYSAKRDGTEDLSYRSKIKRNYAGAKGIGRMSCDRLAQKLQLVTKTESDIKAQQLDIDWNEFDKDQYKEFGDISIPHSTVQLDNVFPQKANHGTILKFSSLNSEWTPMAICELRKSLEKMINPFAEKIDFEIEIIAPEFESFDNNLREKANEYHAQLKNEKAAECYRKITNGCIVNSISNVLSLKTTQIESRLLNNEITTTLTDRGTLMYKISEPNPYEHLNDVSISLYYLNRSAKYNFSLKMGVDAVNYGNIFLFRNGFRILPYGETTDDSWGLNLRAKQGYNRYLGTRDLIGRVDVETNSVEEFKEVSSRDGGLISSPSTEQLFIYFNSIHRRLERYVVGVLWGVNFIQNEYFRDKNIAEEEKKKLQESAKEEDNAKHVYNSIGSRVDFVQLIKNLVNDSNVQVIEYNHELADIVLNPSELDKVQDQFINDLRKVAEKTGDENLRQRIDHFEEELKSLKKSKEEAEMRAYQETERRILAEKEKKEELEKRIEVEKERNAQIQKNKYLISTRNTSKEVQDLMHTVLISSTELSSLISTQELLLQEDTLDKATLIGLTKSMKFNIDRIQLLSSLITKADISILRESKDVDICEYSKEFLSSFVNDLNISIQSEDDFTYIKKLSILELSIILQNLVSNSRKAHATEVMISFSHKENDIVMDFSDNGDGIDLNRFTKESIFEEGVTSRSGGSGIGLSTIKEALQDNLNGDIDFLGNGMFNLKGATFRIVLY